MGKSYEFQDEEGESYRVSFGLLETAGKVRRYGIRAEISGGGKKGEAAEAKERFITKDEAEETMEMLCRFQVTPCTLCDII